MDSIDAVLESVSDLKESDGAESSISQTIPQVDAEELGSRILPLLKLVQASNGLDEQGARTVVYYAIATYGLVHIDKFPILTIWGPAGTGKTTLLEVIQLLASKTIKPLIDGKASRAALRDTLWTETTALIDEADDVDEGLLISRYSRKSSNMPIKRPGSHGWTDQMLNVFGATVLHRRKPFKDPAVLSRSILVRTKKTKVDVYHSDKFAPFAPILMAIADLVDWDNIGELGGDRIADTWSPLLAVDSLLCGKDWRCYADKEMEAARANLELGHEMEPSQAVFLALLSKATSEGTVAERVRISDISKSLQDEQELNSWQVGSTLRALGFKTKNVGGNQYVYTGGKDNMKIIGRELGVEDEWLEEEESTEA